MPAKPYMDASQIPSEMVDWPVLGPILVVVLGKLWQEVKNARRLSEQIGTIEEAVVLLQSQTTEVLKQLERALKAIGTASKNVYHLTQSEQIARRRQRHMIKHGFKIDDIDE